MKGNYKEGEIIDEENYSPEADQKFSHQTLVMKTMNKCIEAGCKEMRAGYFNQKVDRQGNIVKIYIEDTRKVFIESVETLEVIMICDLDKEAKDKLKEIEKDIEEELKKLCEEEKKDWANAPATIKNSRILNSIYYKENSLSKNLSYYGDYIEEQVKTARRKFKELTKLTERKGFYEEEYYEG